MPFQMVHLSIAYNILLATPQIRNKGDFMLGALAPDSVHFRDNYDSGMKKASHLCVGDEKWGRTTNDGEWTENVIAFMHANEHSPRADFIYGFCSHVLVDIQNNIKIWTPFRLANETSLGNGEASIYHREANAVDYALYQLHPQREAIWQIVEKAVGCDIPNVVAADEIGKMKKHVLYRQFTERETEGLSSNKYVTVSSIQEFIAEESQYIRNVLLTEQLLSADLIFKPQTR